MSSILIIDKEKTNADPVSYSPFGPFAARSKNSPNIDAVELILGFLGPQDLRVAEFVCQDWRTSIESTKQWEKQCKYKLGLADKTDSKSYLPDRKSHKEIFHLITPCIHDRAFYRRYIGDTGPVPEIPQEISPKKCDLPDRCDPSKLIGKEYVWVPFPSHVTITVPEDSTLHLSGPDDPANPEAPRLVCKEDEPSPLALLNEPLKPDDPAIDPRRVHSRTKVIQVPITLNNLRMLTLTLEFKRSREKKIRRMLPNNYPFTLALPSFQLDKELSEQHGNKRMVAGWGCMKRTVIGKNRTFDQQRVAANTAGVQLTDLLRRVWFNIFERARCGFFPDGKKNEVYTFARTSTLVPDDEGNVWPSGCGPGGGQGLDLDTYDYLEGNEACDEVGIAVELSKEVKEQQRTL